jgi:hypothetical protein
MRAMSFMLTTQQILDETKDVTRRDGWEFLKSGDRLRAVEKAMGLKKGQKQRVLKLIEVVSVNREELRVITANDCRREGLPNLTPAEFVSMFCRSHKGCTASTVITRIEFKYVKDQS